MLLQENSCFIYGGYITTRANLFCLSVAADVVLVVFFPKDVEVNEHEDAVFFCAFNTSLNIDISWEKENGILPEEPRRSITTLKSPHILNVVRF